MDALQRHQELFVASLAREDGRGANPEVFDLDIDGGP